METPDRLSLCALRLTQVVPHIMALIGGEVRQFGQSQQLSPTQFHVLKAIQHGAVQPSELARRLRVSMSSMTDVVDLLVDRGLVVREADPADRRQVRLALTPAGDQLYTTAWASVRAFLQEHLQALTPAQQTRLLAALDDLERVLVMPQTDRTVPACPAGPESTTGSPSSFPAISLAEVSGQAARPDQATPMTAGIPHQRRDEGATATPAGRELHIGETD